MEAPLLEGDSHDRSEGRGIRPTRGMESVVATVSGYHGTERFKLIKLIAQTGANYVGAMGRSTTHLVCRRFEGKKYDMARDFGTIIISHRWFEDCLNEGKRLPEDPYTLQSGQDAGPISWEATDALDTRAKKKSLLARERNALSNLSNASNRSKRPEIDARCSDVGFLNWSVSHLLNESSFPSWDPKMNGSKSTRKLKKDSKQDHKSGNKDHIRQPVNGLGLWPEESSSFSCLPRHKRNLLDANGRDESARRNHRLVKKNNLQNHAMMDHRREYCLPESCVHLEGDYLHTRENMSASSSQQGTSENMPFNCDGSRIEGLEEAKDVGELSKSSLMRNNESSTRGATLNNEHSGHGVKCADSCDPGEYQNGQMQESDDLAEPDGVHTQTEVSCVICWTEFCSKRGVLSCGHRFCFSCIQGWADCLASKGKVATCPLCKTSFTSITKLEGAASPDQKIYSQTIPCGSSKMDFLMLLHSQNENFGIWPSDSVCYECQNREPEDLLVSCHLCQRQSVHVCCLDPPLVPWTCIHCRDLRTLYQRFR